MNVKCYKKGKYYNLLKKFNDLKLDYGMKHFPKRWQGRKSDSIEVRTKPFFHVQLINDNNQIIYFTQKVKNLEDGCKKILQYLAQKCGCENISELELRMAIDFGI